MAKYKLTREAVKDLTTIWEYTWEKWSEKQADSYYELLLENCQHIADNPNIGKSYFTIQQELFGLKIKRHIIFYRKLDNQPIEITRILHERMDLKTRLDK
jgi:toxin ParE1/3/4